MKKMKTTRTVVILLCMMLTMPSYLLPGSYAAHRHALRQANNEAARKFDEYGDLIQDDEGARLDAFENELKKEPEARAYIIAYGGRDDPAGKARRYALRAKAYLVEARGIAANRVVPVDGGRRNNTTTVELWIVPAGAPAPTPSVSIEQRDVHETRKYDEYI